MAAGEWTDRFGSVASTVCALHCALCAFLPVVFSATGLGFMLAPKTEWTFAIVAMLFAAAALMYGWPRHRSRRIAGLMAVGIVGLMVSRGLEMGVDHHDHGTSGDHHGSEGDVHASDHHGSEGHADEADGDHHGDAAEGGHADHKAHHDGEAEETHGDHEDHHDGEGDWVHQAGALVGVFSGLILLVGHISNIRAIRRKRDD